MKKIAKESVGKKCPTSDFDVMISPDRFLNLVMRLDSYREFVS